MAIEPQDYALVIGLNDYPRFGAAGRPLTGAIEDAQSVAVWLQDADTGGGLPNGHCRLVVSTPEPLQPDRRVIDEALEAIWNDAKVGGGRRMYFYFSGHGQAKSPSDVALCLCHWSSTFRYAALSSHGYRDFLMSCTPFTEIVILLDCCRVRSIDATGSSTELSCPIAVEDAGAKRVFVAHAAEFQSAAYEAAVDPNAGEEGPVARGHFTQALLAGLRGGAARPAGGVTARDLKRYLENEVPRIAKAHEHSQVARVDHDFPEDAQPIFGAAVPAANFQIDFSPVRHGAIRLEDGVLRVVREGDASTGPWDVQLSSGLHRITELATGAHLDIRFVPEDGVTHVSF